jgi:hypothetical protein
LERKVSKLDFRRIPFVLLRAADFQILKAELGRRDCGDFHLRAADHPINWPGPTIMCLWANDVAKLGDVESCSCDARGIEVSGHAWIPGQG